MAVNALGGVLNSREAYGTELTLATSNGPALQQQQPWRWLRAISDNSSAASQPAVLHVQLQVRRAGLEWKGSTSDTQKT